jgi:predicted HAD superfamily hydrolase
MTNVYKTTIQKLFKKNFEKYKNKKIILYGTSMIAGFIMEEFSDYNIIGFLDGKKKYGTAYGKKIFSYEEIVQYKPDIIIIAAAKGNMEMIYDRLCYMCYTNRILIYAIDGRNLFTTFGYTGLTAEQEKYQEFNELALREEIMNHDVISFDIFDVLIMRKTIMKTDILYIIENKLSKIGIRIPNYKEMRQKAEEEVVGKFSDIYDIYIKLIEYTGISSEIANQALTIELEVENSVICCREKVKELLLFAVKNGKKVYLIEDSYFPEKIMRDILEKYGITQYKNLFLSCEYDRTKEQGLYNVLKNEAKGMSYLHVGTKAETEDVYVENNYIDTFILKSAYDMFCMSSYRSLQYSLKSINERSMAGILIAKVFNNPFTLYHASERPKIDCIYDFGYIFIAPLITKYVLWIIDEVKNAQYTDILFAARDGMIVHKLYDFALKELRLNIPRGIYLQTSRTVCSNASVIDEDDISWIAEVPYAYSPELMLRRRFNLEEDEVEQYNENIHKDIVSYALNHKDIIYEKSKVVRNNYLKYMKMIGLQKGKKYAFVDFVSSGTCQLLLNKFIPFNIEGLYFCRYNVNDEAKMSLPVKSLFENLIEKYVYCSYSYENYLFLETVMTSLKPSLASVNENGEPVFGTEERSKEELQYVIDVHSAIENYFYEFIKNLYVDDSEINKYFVDTIFSYREQKYTNECCSIFDNLILLEDFGQWRMPLHRNY